jgi:hypothetical protein
MYKCSTIMEEKYSSLSNSHALGRIAGSHAKRRKHPNRLHIVKSTDSTTSQCDQIQEEQKKTLKPKRLVRPYFFDT